MAHGHPPSSTNPEPPAVLVALPKGAGLSGITTWAAALGRGLAALGHDVMLLVHDVPGVAVGESIVRLEGERGIEVRILSGMPPIDADGGGDPREDRPEAPEYVRAVRDLSRSGRRCVVAIPTYSAECFGLLAAVSRSKVGESLRVVGWCHNDIAYDRLTLSHYRSLLHRIVGVSSQITERLRGAIRDGAAEESVLRVPYGVAVPDRLPSKPIGSASLRGTGRPALRLVYTGRMDIEQKRVAALVGMSDSLAALSIDHELVLVGSGPAAGMIDRSIAGSTRVRRVEESGPAGVSRWLSWADVFVLASRYEGLSLSMLEAMAHGCALVVTRVSGATDAVGEGADVCGVIVDAGAGVDETQLPRQLAEGVRRAMDLGLERLGSAGWHRAGEHFSEAAMARRVSAICHDLSLEQPRRWPDGVPTRAGDFTVPANAVERTARALRNVTGSRVALWGAGRHTRAVLRGLGEHAEVLSRVACVLDDAGALDAGRTCGPWPVVGHDGLRERGITDVLISSALHEDDLWERRSEIERLGIRVHRVYGDPAQHEDARDSGITAA